MEGEKDAGTRLVKGQMTAKVLSVTDGGAGCSSLIFGRRDLNGGVTWLANDGGPLGLLGEKRARREEGQVLEARAARDMRMPGAGVAERGGLLPLVAQQVLRTSSKSSSTTVSRRPCSS